jgi:arylsulfatase A-like enzyme
MQRRQFLTSAAAAASGLTSHAKASSPRPNLLFILADQWRGSAFGFGTDQVVRTPHFDSLAQQGANWTRAYATNPVCVANRACILTGRYPHQNGMGLASTSTRENLGMSRPQLPPHEICWPELLRSAGYRTHYIGKWHLDGANKSFIPKGWRRRGFETFEGFNNGHVYYRPLGFDNEGFPLTYPLSSEEPYYEPAVQTARAMELMSDHKKQYRDRPFACYLSWGPPHAPYDPPPGYDHYARGDIILRENVPPECHDQARRILAGYYGLCESLDHQMGRLLNFLQREGLANNTLLIFTSDHGCLAGSHGKFRKGNPEDEALRVPLLMRWPGRIPAGYKAKTLIGSVDLMPTLLSLCGLPVPVTCAGRDLSAVATKRLRSNTVDSIYCEGRIFYNSSWRAIVTNRYKMVVKATQGKKWKVKAFYNLEKDPFEMRNLAGKPQLQEREKNFLEQLKEWAARTGDSGRLVPALSQYDDP